MEKNDERKKVTIRTAPNFGYQLASNLGIQLEKENEPATRWPIKFPITFRQITKLPEVNKDDKIARKIVKAAQAMWQDLREAAVEIEKDMKLHPEYYELVETGVNDIRSVWRELSIELEQIAGNIFVTQFDDEDSAKENVYKLLSARNLKSYMIEFKDDYKNFIDEVREAIRPKKEILPSIRLEMICLLNVNTKAAGRALKKKPTTLLR